MKFTFEGEEFKISFEHEQRGSHRHTGCHIWRVTEGGKDLDHTPFCEGWSHCNPSDVFCKESGRKLSLSRALNSTMRFLDIGSSELILVTNLPSHWDRRAFRTAAWKAYLGRKAMVTVSA